MRHIHGCTQVRRLILSAMLVPSLAAAAGPSSSQCLPILEQLIPGDYHYCVAVHDWEKGLNRNGFFEARYAAAWGDKRAQFDLGVYYFDGRRGVKADHATGLAWLTLAAERKDPHYLSVLASAQARATAEEQRQAADLVAKMQDRYGDTQTKDRAEKRYRTEMWSIRDKVWGVLLSNPVDPWSNNIAVEIDGLGVVQPMYALEALQSAGNTYFQGWGGNVAVGPLVQIVKRPSSVAPAQTNSRVVHL